MPTREHIFKAKRKDNGEWVEGDLTNNYDGRKFIGETIAYEIIPETVCEYTGLTDKNVTKIFEGDILLGHLDDDYPEDETIVTVVWHKFKWCLQQDDFYPDELDANDGERFEVIGNIYDNPGIVGGWRMNWISVKDRLPQEKVIVNTKIEDENGIRNEQPLYRYKNLWFLADGSMYVYYNPTHWMPLPEPPEGE